MQGAPVDPQLRNLRHFGLLAAAVVTVAAARYEGLLPRIVCAFAWFGALHATSLALSLRRSVGGWRVLGFIAAASLLSASVASLGMHSVPLLAGRGAADTLLVIAACAFAGAAGYGILLRWVLRYQLGLAPLAMTALACALAVCAVLEVLRRHAAAGGIWLAVSWWLAFSLSLYVHGRRARS
jgi:hypothetical protein